MPRRCGVCADPRLDEIEDYYFKHDKRVDLTLKAMKAKYGNDWTFTYDRLQKHFRKHVVPVIEASIETSKLRRKIIQSDIKQDIKMSTTLMESLTELKRQFEELKNGANNPKTRNELRNVIKEIRFLIEVIIKFKKETNIENINIEDELEKKIMYSIENACPGCKSQFLKRWGEYDTR